MSATFTKRAAPAGSGFYAVEAAGLRWLAEAGGSAARVVEILEVGDDFIQLERLTPVSPSPAAAAGFGADLARTHAAGAEFFGSPPAGWTAHGFIGQQTLSLLPTPTWGTFFATQRLQPYARRARELGHLTPAGSHRIDRVCERLVAGDFDDDRPPARIHGDLWSGNLVFTDPGVVLIDPAAHGGHGLTDLAMLHLFGAPHLEVMTAAYAASTALPDDWADLIGLHQLHPLLVHAVTHSPAYGAEAVRLAAYYL